MASVAPVLLAVVAAFLLGPAAHAADCFPTDTIRFGMPTSAEGTKHGVKSKQIQEGYRLAMDKINADGGVKCGDKTYRMVITETEDDNSSSVTVKTAMTKLIDSGNIDFVLSPYSSGLSGAATEVTNARGMAIIYPAASADSLFNTPLYDGRSYDPKTNDKYGQLNFSISTPASHYQYAVLDALSAKSAEKICILCRDPAVSTFPQKVALGALEYAKTLGITVIDDEVKYHKEADAETIIGQQLKDCRDAGADAILANTNNQFDAEHYVNAAAKAYGNNNPWWPKIMSVTAYAAEPKFIDDMGENSLHILGPTQWAPDLLSTPDVAGLNGGSVLGTSKDVADAYFDAYGSMPSYQAAGAVVVGLIYKLGIEAAAQRNPGQAITQQMFADALYAFNDVPSFYAKLNFQDSGVLSDSLGGTKPMYTTQIQLTTTGEIPVVLPKAYASANTKAGASGAKFEFEYPSLKYVAQQAGRQRAAPDMEQLKAELKAEKDKECDSGDDGAASLLMIVFIVIAALLVCAILGMLFMERRGEPCCAPKRLPSQLA